MKDNRAFIDDVIALSGNVLGNILGARHEVKAQAKQRMNSVAKHLDFVSREEFDAAFAMLAKARTMQEELSERLSAVEARLNVSRGSVIKSQTKRRLHPLKKSNRRKISG